MESNSKKMASEFWKYFRIPIILYGIGLILNVLYKIAYTKLGAVIGVSIGYLSLFVLCVASITMVYMLIMLYSDERKALKK